MAHEEWYAVITRGLNYDPEQEEPLVAGTRLFTGRNAPHIKRPFFPDLTGPNLARLIGRLELNKESVDLRSYQGHCLIMDRKSGNYLAQSDVGDHYLFLEDVHRSGLLLVTYGQSEHEWSALVTFEGEANKFVAAARRYVEVELRSPLILRDTIWSDFGRKQQKMK